MSLNPEDSRRRGRSKSPGRRDDRDRSRSRVDDPRERSRTRTVIERTASPSISSYTDARHENRDRNGRRYEFEEETLNSVSRLPAKEEDRYRRDASADGRSQYSKPGDFDKSNRDLRKYSGRKEKIYHEEKKSVRKTYSSDESSPEHSFPGRGDRPPSSRSGDDPRYSTAAYKNERIRYEDDYRDARRADHKDQDRRKWEEEVDRRARAEYEAEKAKKLRDRGFHADASARIDIGRGTASPSGNWSKASPPHKYAASPSHDSDLAYGASPPMSNAKRYSYIEPKQWEYARPGEVARKESYGNQRPEYDRRESQTQVSYGGSGKYGHSPHSSQTQIPYGQPMSQGNVITVEPNHRRSTSGVNSLTPHMNSLSVSTGHHSLSVNTGHNMPISLANAPGSPLLESYHGTYQAMSPMPSPLMLASQPYSSSFESFELNSATRQRHARFHDPAESAAAIAKALKGNKEPDGGPLIDILPALTHDQIMELRIEYKNLVKTGSERKGVNVAKHIKLRLKEQDPSFMKACYTTALGKWESEAYWANFWYQGEKSRRELLIESLMGRTNYEIMQIKEAFSDKKYSDSLTKCMKTELKEDKFKKAVLLVLEGKRMEEPRPGHYVDMGLVEDDVRTLHKSVRAEKGGESAMIQIVVLRSDAHIREILKVYEAAYRTNFAREMLKKSGNLVGELLAHILNGVLNRPVRDALLLNHALTLTKSDHLRTELLISRLVRYHWDGAHMEAVKREYKSRYGRDLVVAVREGTKGAWGMFCEELCVRRMPGDVRRLEMVEALAY